MKRPRAIVMSTHRSRNGLKFNPQRKVRQLTMAGDSDLRVGGSPPASVETYMHL